MNKPAFKVVDRKGKVLIPLSLRQHLGIDNGDTVSLTAGNGKIVIQKAVVADDKKIPRESKYYYAQAAISEADVKTPLDQLKLIARLLQDLE